MFFFVQLVGRFGFSLGGGDIVDTKKLPPEPGKSRPASTINISKSQVEAAQRKYITDTMTKVIVFF